eukprot:jgi/Chrzof1/3716/Cz13g06100.t1
MLPVARKALGSCPVGATNHIPCPSSFLSGPIRRPGSAQRSYKTRVTAQDTQAHQQQGLSTNGFQYGTKALQGPRESMEDALACHVDAKLGFTVAGV